jgi:short-subunit dehydrogenase
VADRPMALVTGASAGIGRVFAQRLAHDGYDLVVVARRRELLEELAEDLNKRYGAQVEVLTADLSNRDDVRAVERRIAQGPFVELLVNNAGFGGGGPLARADIDRVERMLLVNIVASTRLTHAALPRMIEQGRGAVINVSSNASFIGLHGHAGYGGTKAYLNIFTEALALELEGTGVRVQSVCPPNTVNERWTWATERETSKYRLMTTEDLVHGSLAGLELGEVICTPSIHDPQLLVEDRKARERLLAASQNGALAARYDWPPQLDSRTAG